MNFEEWLNETMTPNHNDLQPDEAAGMGWGACKKEVLKIIKKHTREVCSHGHDAGTEFAYTDELKTEIEKL